MNDDLKSNDHQKQKQQVQREQQEKEITVDIESNSNSDININNNNNNNINNNNNLNTIHKSKDETSINKHHHHHHHHHHSPSSSKPLTTSTSKETRENIEHKTIKEDNSDKENKKSTSDKKDIINKDTIITKEKDKNKNSEQINKNNNETNNNSNSTTLQKQDLEKEEEKLFRNQLLEFYSANGNFFNFKKKSFNTFSFFKFYNRVSGQGGYLKMKQENWNELSAEFEVKSSELKKRYLDYLVDFEKVFLKGSSLDDIILGSVKDNNNVSGGSHATGSSSSIVNNSNSNSYSEKNDNEPKLGDVLAVTTRSKRKDILQGQPYTPPISTEPTRIHGIFYDKDLDYNKTLCIFSKKTFIEILKKRAYNDHFKEDQLSDDSTISNDSRTTVKKLKTTATTATLKKANDTSANTSANTSPVLEEATISLKPLKKKISSNPPTSTLNITLPTTPPSSTAPKDITPRLKKETDNSKELQQPPIQAPLTPKDNKELQHKDKNKESIKDKMKDIEMKDIKDASTKINKTNISINKEKVSSEKLKLHHHHEKKDKKEKDIIINETIEEPPPQPKPQQPQSSTITNTSINITIPAPSPSSSTPSSNNNTINTSSVPNNNTSTIATATATATTTTTSPIITVPTTTTTTTTTTTNIPQQDQQINNKYSKFDDFKSITWIPMINSENQEMFSEKELINRKDELQQIRGYLLQIINSMNKEKLIIENKFGTTTPTTPTTPSKSNINKIK